MADLLQEQRDHITPAHGEQMILIVPENWALLSRHVNGRSNRILIRYLFNFGYGNVIIPRGIKIRPLFLPGCLSCRPAAPPVFH